MNTLFFKQALLASGWAENVHLQIDDNGYITALNTGVVSNTIDAAIAVPGMPNLHSHAFQRGMAGLAEVKGGHQDSFWTWRQIMYRFLERLTPDDLQAIAAQLYVEMLEAGFTSVGEFHYLHHAPDGCHYMPSAAMAESIIAAADHVGINLTLLPVFYANSGFGGAPVKDSQRRFYNNANDFLKLREAAAQLSAQTITGLALHSLRALTPAAMAEVIAACTTGPIHIHIAEQVKEVDDCIAWSGQRPVQWLLDHIDVDQRWCLVHATHMSAEETIALANSRAVAGLCPITEANLGDGIFNGVSYLQAGGRFGIGSDSHVFISVAEELRLLEYSQRLRDLSRNCLATNNSATGRVLFEQAVAGGVQALTQPSGQLAPGFRADIVSLDAEHPALLMKSGDALLNAWVFAGDNRVVQDVWIGGRQLVTAGQHQQRELIKAQFAATLKHLLSG